MLQRLRNVFVSRGSAANYPNGIGIRTSVSRRRRRRSVVLPLALMSVAFAGSVFGYLNLIAPPREVSKERTDTVSAAAKPAPAAPAEPTPAIVAEAFARLSSAPRATPEPAAEAVKPQPPAPSPPVEAAPSPSVKARATASIVSREVALAERAKRDEPAGASEPRAAAPIPVPPEAPVGAGATAARIIEVKPLLKEQAPAAAYPGREAIAAAPSPVGEPLTTARAEPTPPDERRTIARAAPRPADERLSTARAAPTPADERLATARAAPVEQAPVPRPVLKEQPAPAPALPKEPPTRDNSWQTRLRTELAACGRPGFLRNDLCRETTRWNYCHPDRWGTVRECTVERFASSGSPE